MGHQVLLHKVWMLNRCCAQIGEDDALLRQGVVNFVVDGLVVDEGEHAALLVAKQRLPVLYRDVFEAPAVGRNQHTGAVPVDVPVVSTPPGFVLGGRHGQRFVKLPCAEPRLAQPIRFVIAFAQGFDVGAGERRRRKFACNTTTSCHC